MKKPVIDEARLPEVMKLISDADSLMSEKDCENDNAAKKRLEELQIMDWWLRYLKMNTGLSNVSDYIFYPNLIGLERDSSLEQIADKIVADRS